MTDSLLVLQRLNRGGYLKRRLDHYRLYYGDSHLIVDRQVVGQAVRFGYVVLSASGKTGRIGSQGVELLRRVDTRR